MPELILVRHAETTWNVGEVFRGRLDVALNDTGHRQADRLADYLAGEDISAIFASPLSRALETARPLAERCGLAVKIEPRLIDLDFGEWQGLDREEVMARFPEMYRLWQEHPESAVPPGGESLAAVRERSRALVTEVLAGPVKKVVFTTHRVVSKVLICALLGLENDHFWNIHQDTCGVTTFLYDRSFVLLRHNDTAHLRALGPGRRADF
ncbi:MAG: histidine phosphatase family protein [Chloroflexota bacterium]